MCKPGYFASVDLTETKTSKMYRCRTGDGGVSNCAYPGRYVFASGEVVRYCMGCAKNYIGQNYSGLVNAPTSCTKNTTGDSCVTNCEYCSQDAYESNYCWACSSGYVAANDGLSCVAETTTS